jgi:K+/H+ antiporter YhaU regulatory subunit KhtT
VEGVGSVLAGRTLLDANLRHRFGVILVGIQHNDRRMGFNPSHETVIHAGDRLVVLGRADSLKKLEWEASR